MNEKVSATHAQGRTKKGRQNWHEDLKRQVTLRNSIELAPTLSVFQSYAALHTHVLLLQARDNERVRLAAQNAELHARVRELEKAAADFSVRSAREVELEARKDELQDKLQRFLEKENEYYRGMAELSTWRQRAEAAEARAAAAEADLDKRNAELALIKKEYVSLREENARMRGSISEADTSLLRAKTAEAKAAQHEKRVRELTAELTRLKASLASPRGQRPVAQQDRGEDQTEGVAPLRNAEAEEELLPISNNSGGTEEPSAKGTDAKHHHSNPNATGEANSFSPYPRKAFRVIEDAHNGAVLQSCCFGDGVSTAPLIFTSGSDKAIKVWDLHSSSSGSAFTDFSHDARADSNFNASVGSGSGNSGGGEKRKFSSGGSIALSLHCASHYLLAGCVDKIARFWDTRTLRMLELVGHSEKLVSVCLSSTAQHGFTASSDSTIKLWDIRTRATLRTLLCQSTANDVTVAGENIFSCHYNGNLICWDRRAASKSCEIAKAHQRIATCVRISNDGRLCVSLGKDNTISVRDTRVMTQALRTICPSTLTVSMNWSRLALSPDSKVVAVGSSRGQVICAVLDKAYEAEVAAACPYFPNNFSAAPHSAVDCSDPDDGVMNVLERGGHDRERPIPCVVWGRAPYAPLASIGEDRRLVLWR